MCERRALITLGVVVIVDYRLPTLSGVPSLGCLLTMGVPCAWWYRWGGPRGRLVYDGWLRVSRGAHG